MIQFNKYNWDLGFDKIHHQCFILIVLIMEHIVVGVNGKINYNRFVEGHGLIWWMGFNWFSS